MTDLKLFQLCSIMRSRGLAILCVQETRNNCTGSRVLDNGYAYITSGKDNKGKDIFMRDIWPSNKEIEETLKSSLTADMFIKRYSNVSEGPKQWQEIKTEKSSIYKWEENSTYVKLSLIHI